ncbi:MAG: amino acid ABC transporter substrate-binding protein, partial [Betaproteobacteria bacterium]
MKWFPRALLGLAALSIAVAVSAQDLTGTLKKAKDTGAFT